MHFLPEKLDEYIVSHSETEPKLLQQLTRETYQKILQPIMLSGPYQGRVLSMISKLKSPENIIELGTFTGYSTLCLAEGLAKEGTIHTIDINEELEDFQRKYFDKSSYGEQIIQHVGNALEIIPKINVMFDLVFIDADKPNYSNYFHLIIDKLNSGGIILSDNVLWHGEVAKEDNLDKYTINIREFNNYVSNDNRVEQIIVPLGDGMTVCRFL